MAGGSSADDNPVALNVVPMVDVIFCLCVFFMCSFQFKALEGRFESWLPKDVGNGPMLADPVPEMRVVMTWDESRARTAMHFGMHSVETPDQLSTLLAGAHEDCVRIGRADTPVIVDSDVRVPWDQVMSVVNLSKRLGIGRFEFARGAR